MRTQSNTYRAGVCGRSLVRWITVATLALAAGCSGGETVISGVGNSGNHLGMAALWHALAEELAEHEATPIVTDEEIALVYKAIHRNALEGDLDSSLVLLKLAEEQRDD